MLEKIIELLLGLAVGAASAAGIGVAQETAPNAGDPTGIAEKVAAWERAAEARLNAEHETETDTEADVQSADGLATALAALAEAMELAPEAADFGLGTAWDAVDNAPSGEGGRCGRSRGDPERSAGGRAAGGRPERTAVRVRPTVTLLASNISKPPRSSTGVASCQGVSPAGPPRANTCQTGRAVGMLAAASPTRDDRHQPTA